MSLRSQPNTRQGRERGRSRPRALPALLRLGSVYFALRRLPYSLFAQIKGSKRNRPLRRADAVRRCLALLAPRGTPPNSPPIAAQTCTGLPYPLVLRCSALAKGTQKPHQKLHQKQQGLSLSRPSSGPHRQRWGRSSRWRAVLATQRLSPPRPMSKAPLRAQTGPHATPAPPFARRSEAARRLRRVGWRGCSGSLADRYLRSAPWWRP